MNIEMYRNHNNVNHEDVFNEMMSIIHVWIHVIMHVCLGMYQA